MKKVITVLLVLAVLVASAFSVYADESSDGKINSWRYSNGQLRKTAPSASGASNAWEWTDEGFVNDRNELIDEATMKGVDVSVWNGLIDWEKVAETDVDYAIIRIGFGSDYLSQDDIYAERNIRGCVENGIPFGVYLYSYAENTEMAKSEAEHTLRVLKTVHDNISAEVGEYDLNFPVFYDMEDERVQAGLSPARLGEMAKAYCTAIRKNGYKVGIYANLYWWNNHLTDPYFSTDYLCRWVAQYNSYCTYTDTYDMWQCTDSGYVYGIGSGVDLNFWYNDYITNEDYARNTGIQLDKKSLVINRKQSDEKARLTATVFSAAGDNSVTWTSDNEKTATVNKNGVITAKKRGKCNIIATMNDGSGKTAKCSITVNQLVTKITLSKKEITLSKKGKTKQLKSTAKPTNANKPKIKWTSTNTSIAKVNQNGFVTAKKKGTCYIKATATDNSNTTAKCKVTVKK